jgi:hypothetical protein
MASSLFFTCSFVKALFCDGVELHLSGSSGSSPFSCFSLKVDSLLTFPFFWWCLSSIIWPWNHFGSKRRWIVKWAVPSSLDLDSKRKMDWVRIYYYTLRYTEIGALV